MHDYYSSIKKDSLVNSHGIKYYDFVATLTPRYHILWPQLLSGHLAIILVSWATIVVGFRNPALIPILVPFSALILGYAVAYIMLFLHEAAHHNLSKDRQVNDILSNIFIGSLLGQNINDYRGIHWGHHRYHGETNDPEHVYFDPLNISFLMESLSGIKLLRVGLDRKKRLKEGLASERPSWESKVMLVVGLLINGTILAWSLWSGHIFFIFTWLIALMIFFPFFASLRPILEHRDEKAESGIDYSKTSHGITNRLFGDGSVASTFGGAGFNRHLLHHIEPKISYTRLKEFEDYLMDTQFKEEIKRHQTTYWKTFINLFES
jgi:fatty acid desaturase